jgi:hypothetical protein
MQDQIIFPVAGNKGGWQQELLATRVVGKKSCWQQELLKQPGRLPWKGGKMGQVGGEDDRAAASPPFLCAIQLLRFGRLNR